MKLYTSARSTLARTLRGTTLASGLTLAALSVSAGCNNAGEGALSGAALGAGAGAIIGSFTGSAGIGAIIGGAAGALGGGVIGDQNARNTASRNSTGYYR